MQKILQVRKVKASIAAAGLSQSALAKELGVSAQAITNWLKGVDFPRPDKLLKLAVLLKLSFEDLVATDSAGEPVIAFRKRAGTKTTDVHIAHAKEIGMLLKPLVPYLQGIHALRPQFSDGSTEYRYLQKAASETRELLGLGDVAVLEYHHLIGRFKEAGAVLVPVLWGTKNRHENALHIHLPQEKVTFIFLNLDTSLEDFKFWMAHELAHVYTPTLAGTEDGEDFADAFAATLLFPYKSASLAYSDCIKQRSPGKIVTSLLKHAEAHSISLFTVYGQVEAYAKAENLPGLGIPASVIHATRNNIGKHIPFVSEALFDPLPPHPREYIHATDGMFRSDFFRALRVMLNERKIGPSYVQQILDIGIADAASIHAELSD